METATGITYETFRAMAVVGRRPQAGTLRSVDAGLGWLPGSAARVMAGGTPEESPGWLPATPPAGDADQVRAALRALALTPDDLEAARGRYDFGDPWMREVAMVMRRVLRDDIDDGVRRLLLAAVSRSVTRVLTAQRAEADDIRCLMKSAGIPPG